MSTHVKRGFHCDATWHIHQMGALSLAIYDKIGAITRDRLTGEYGTWYTSGRSLAEFYGASENHVTSVLRGLRRLGWLRLVGHGPGTVIEENGVSRNVKANRYKPKNYRYVTHEEWLKAHPGRCFVREEMVWDGEEHDALAQTLHKQSFGMTFWYPNMLAGLRASGMTDEEIAATWLKHVQELPKKPKRKGGWKRIALAFVRDIKSEELAAVRP